MDADEIRRQLPHFTGTNDWYKHRSGILYTDGVKFLAEQAGAFWLIDLIASYQKRCRKDPTLRDFQLWKLEKTGDKTARVTCSRDDGQPAFHQDIPFTDFPLEDIQLYLENETLMLPGER